MVTRSSQSPDRCGHPALAGTMIHGARHNRGNRLCNIRSNNAKNEIDENTEFMICGSCGRIFGSHEAAFYLCGEDVDDCDDDPKNWTVWQDVFATCPECGEQSLIGEEYHPRISEIIKKFPPSEERLHAATLATRYGLPEQRQPYDEISDKYGLPAPENKEQSLADKYGLSFSRKKRSGSIKRRHARC